MKVIRRAVVRGRGARTIPDDRPADPTAPDPLQHARRGLERVITVDPALCAPRPIHRSDRVCRALFRLLRPFILCYAPFSRTAEGERA